MRQFKYRIWDKEKAEWFLTKRPFSLFGECVLLGGLFFEINSSKLDNYIIQQFTELYDSEGMEIYEGDIVERDGIYSRYLVKYNTSQACWVLSYESDYIYLGDFTDLKVIGNIFESPELLS